ncbi:MAG: hypothetical protein Unbinned1446contig1005_38 [Prokaryotic dsDNA virus sp.]|nr:MAG: hypothetical protein Unbinned1446contig1005_38 [Prokaryotic dsDNA virus sp.]|tara:strand:+ start:5670 stop:5966 length:297 start_codon:yes stop_codon:yes gene_type:complete
MDNHNTKPIYYYLATVNGRITELPDSRLETLQKAVGGYIAYMPSIDANISRLIVNEEGLLMRLPRNPLASYLAGTVVVGDVVLQSTTNFTEDNNYKWN